MNEQDERVRDYYENLTMSKDRVEMLLKVAQNSEDAIGTDVTHVSGGRSILSKLQWSPWFQTAMGCGLILLVSLWMHTSGSQTELATRTLREVAMNHTTRLEPEFSGSSLASLDNSMHQLPFNLVLPRNIDGEYELIGSRYCSLGGVLAAHVRLHNKKSGKPMSLFVTSNSADLDQIQTQQKKLEGVEVEIWREGGFFYASAHRS